MIATRITPSLVWKVMTAVSASAFILLRGSNWNWWHLSSGDSRLLFSPLAALAYAGAFPLCRGIAAEHRNSYRMRTAWELLATSAAFSVFRHLALAVLSVNAGETPDSLAGYLLTQTLMVCSLVCLLAALFHIWRTFSALHLGFSVHATDTILLLLIVILIPPIILSSSFIPPRQYHPLVPAFRYAGAILLPATTAMGVYLHRLSLQMKGGDMAKVLRCLVVFTGLRLVLMMCSGVAILRSNLLVFDANQAILQGVPYLFTMAAAYRWQITRRARHAIQENQRELSLPAR